MGHEVSWVRASIREFLMREEISNCMLTTQDLQPNSYRCPTHITIKYNKSITANTRLHRKLQNENYEYDLVNWCLSTPFHNKDDPRIPHVFSRLETGTARSRTVSSSS